MILRNNSIFSFSSTLILVKIENNLIQLKILYGTNQNNEYSFNSNKKQYIKLGRIKNNDIDLEFNDESTSRIQTTIFYENKDGVIDIVKIHEQNGNDSNYFISGPPVMIKIFKNKLIERGVPSKNVLTDDWE